jgi:hypothetical protein
VLFQSQKQSLENVFYCNHAIATVILHVFFKGRPLALDLKKLTPMPYQLIAYVCTALKCALDEWATGSYKSIKFSQEAYRDTYVWHRAWWQALEKDAPIMYHNIAKRMTDYCVLMSGMNVGSNLPAVEDEEEEQLNRFLQDAPRIPGWTKPMDDDMMDEDAGDD